MPPIIPPLILTLRWSERKKTENPLRKEIKFRYILYFTLDTRVRNSGKSVNEPSSSKFSSIWSWSLRNVQLLNNHEDKPWARPQWHGCPGSWRAGQAAGCEQCRHWWWRVWLLRSFHFNINKPVTIKHVKRLLHLLDLLLGELVRHVGHAVLLCYPFSLLFTFPTNPVCYVCESPRHLAVCNRNNCNHFHCAGEAPGIYFSNGYRKQP